MLHGLLAFDGCHNQTQGDTTPRSWNGQFEITKSEEHACASIRANLQGHKT